MSDLEFERLDGPRKAAILMILLGPETAGPLLKNLPQDEVARITTEVAAIETIEPELAQSVLEDYFISAVKPEEHRGGRDVARELLSCADIPEQSLLCLDTGHDTTPDLLVPLLETSPKLLVSILAEEQAQTIALVLLNLTPKKAAQVLQALPDDKRSETIGRMTVLGRVRDEILDEVASTLRERLGKPDAVEDEDDGDGMQRTAAVLQAMQRSEVRTLLDAIEKESPERAAELRALVNTFDTLLLADDRGIQELLRLVETKTLTIALKGEEDALVQKFLDNLSERAAGMFREEMEFLSTVRPDDQKKAQNEIMEQALSLEANEKLIFEEPEGEAEAG